MTAANGVGPPFEQVSDNRVLTEEKDAVELADQQPATKGLAASQCLQGSTANTTLEVSISALRHIIGAAVRMSITNGDADIDHHVPRLLCNDVPRVCPTLNQRHGQPFPPSDCQTGPDAWESALTWR